MGYQGVEGSFSDEALTSFFGPDCPKRAYGEFEDVFAALQRGEIAYGVLPMENSSTGAIVEVYDLMRAYELYIVGEQYVGVNQNLLGLPGTQLDQLKEVYSHPQGFAQSSEFLKGHRDWKLTPYHNTAVSAQLVKRLGDRTKGAIASRRAAQLYGLEILAPEIENLKSNTTRFIIVGREFLPQTAGEAADKVSLEVSLDNRPGTLYRLLGYLAENHLNLVKIESRPARGVPWDYIMYLDFEGDFYSPAVQSALDRLRGDAASLRILGAYRKNNG